MTVPDDLQHHSPHVDNLYVTYSPHSPHNTHILDVHINTQLHLVVICKYNFDIEIIDMVTHQTLDTITQHNDLVEHVLFSEDNTYLYCASNNGEITVYDLQNFCLTDRLSLVSDELNAIAHDQKSNTLACASNVNTIVLHAINKNRPTVELVCDDIITHLLFSEDSTQLIAAGTKGIYVYDLHTFTLIHSINEPVFTGFDEVLIVPNSDDILVHSRYDNCFYLLNLATLTLSEGYVSDEGKSVYRDVIDTISISKNGQFVLCNNNTVNTTTLWNLKTKSSQYIHNTSNNYYNVLFNHADSAIICIVKTHHNYVQVLSRDFIETKSLVAPEEVLVTLLP